MIRRVLEALRRLLPEAEVEELIPPSTYQNYWRTKVEAPTWTELEDHMSEEGEEEEFIPPLAYEILDRLLIALGLLTLVQVSAAFPYGGWDMLVACLCALILAYLIYVAGEPGPALILFFMVGPAPALLRYGYKGTVAPANILLLYLLVATIIVLGVADQIIKHYVLTKTYERETDVLARTIRRGAIAARFRPRILRGYVQKCEQARKEAVIRDDLEGARLWFYRRTEVMSLVSYRRNFLLTLLGISILPVFTQSLLAMYTLAPGLVGLLWSFPGLTAILGMGSFFLLLVPVLILFFQTHTHFQLSLRVLNDVFWTYWAMDRESDSGVPFKPGLAWGKRLFWATLAMCAVSMSYLPSLDYGPFYDLGALFGVEEPWLETYRNAVLHISEQNFWTRYSALSMEPPAATNEAWVLNFNRFMGSHPGAPLVVLLAGVFNSDYLNIVFFLSLAFSLFFPVFMLMSVVAGVAGKYLLLHKRSMLKERAHYRKSGGAS